MKYFRYLGLACILMLAGCASSQQNYWGYPPMAVPLQPGVDQEVSLAKINALLARSDTSQADKAQLFKLRGFYHDSVGLRDLARLDYEYSLKLNPKQADVLNMLGVFYTQVAAYDNAIDAFDISLKLEPESNYALRNRAIALYYGNRLGPAFDDMTKAYEADKADPYTALWLFYIERGLDPENAKQNLEARYQAQGQSEESQWGWLLVAMTLGDVSQQEIFENIAEHAENNEQMAQQLTETYFYLAKEFHYEKDYPNAIALFKLAIAQNVYDFAEHHYSFVELGQIFDTLRSEVDQDFEDDPIANDFMEAERAEAESTTN